MKIKKNDKILVISGKYKGKTGKVLKAMPKQNKIIVDGVNIVKKHSKPKKQGEKGKVLQIPSPFLASKAKLVCSKCSKATRVGYSIKNKKKTRICKKCQKTT